MSAMGQRLAGSGVTETRQAGGEGVLSKAPVCSSPGGRKMLHPPAWGWMGCASGSPHHHMLWAQGTVLVSAVHCEMGSM